MDWLEIPNLRSRGLAFVVGRLRRRPPRWAELDREGRLVALYGTVAVLWLVIAVNLGWRIWTDRVDGLVVGLWHSGWPARLLLVAVVCGLAAPLVYFAVGLARRALARAAPAARPAPCRAATRRAASTRCAPPRSVGFPRPRSPSSPTSRTGCARAPASSSCSPAPPSRPCSWSSTAPWRAAAPTTRPATCAQRVGAGGVVGLASALRGAPASLAWHTAGTTLLAVPSSAVVSRRRSAARAAAGRLGRGGGAVLRGARPAGGSAPRTGWA